MTATSRPDRSPAPGIIPEPVHVEHDDAPTAATEDQDEPRLKRRNPVRLVAATVMSALRGEKQMVNAYPAAQPEDAAPSDYAGTNAGDR
jgi:hypothetical protein